MLSWWSKTKKMLAGQWKMLKILFLTCSVLLLRDLNTFNELVEVCSPSESSVDGTGSCFYTKPSNETGENCCVLFSPGFTLLSSSRRNNSLLNRPGCCCFLRLELGVCVLFGRFSGFSFRREHPCHSGRCCAVPSLTWEAEEGSPDEGAAAGEGGPHVQRHQGEVQKLGETDTF